jgi:hypothetical protein
MNLVDELQASATKDDVLNVLRNTRRLASKLKRHDITEWLQAEQDGYNLRFARVLGGFAEGRAA